MKILITVHGDFASTYGGGQTYVQRLVAAMCRLDGVEVSVLSFVSGRNGNLPEFIHNGRVVVYTVDPGISPEALEHMLLEWKPDVIHANGCKSFVCHVARNADIPCIVTAHHGGILCPAGALLNARDEICYETVCHRRCLKCCLNNVRWGVVFYPLLRWIPRSLYLAIGRFLKKLPFLYFITPIGSVALNIEHKRLEWLRICRDCSAIIAPCLAIRKVMENNGMSKDKIIVLPHGVPQPPQVPTYESGEKLKFFYVGRMCYVKGVHILLKAFHSIKNTTIELHFIGSTGNCHEQSYMDSLKNKYAMDSRIRWHGKVAAEKVNDMVARYHVLVHPTICMEIYGLAIAEALSMGKWVLATRCGGAEMQVIDSKNGWLIPANDSSSLRKKMEEIIANPPSSSPVMLRYHTISKHAEALVRIYRTVEKTY